MTSVSTPILAQTIEVAPPVVESARRLITQLAYQGKLPKVIAFTSAFPGEGVSFIARSVAMSIATDMAERVCLVDLNWWAQDITDTKPSRKRREQAPTPPVNVAPGLAAVLANELPLDEAVVPTTTPGLAVLPAGQLPVTRRPAAARSEALAQQLATLSQSYDYLVLDVPPVLHTSDAVVLAGLAGGVCMVVQQGKTSVDHVRLALDDIQNLAILGVVLNRSVIKTPRWLRGFLVSE